MSVCSSVLPSVITIISNVFSVYRVRQLNRLTSNYITPCRRRTDDTRRVLLVITVECLFAILNSWFSDILISVVYCKGTLLADDDCPGYLKANYDLLVMFDMFNSISNIILHCLCGKHFRYELFCMFQSVYQLIKNILKQCCCIQIQCQKNYREASICYHASITDNQSSDSPNSNHIYLKIQPSTSLLRNKYCDCRCYYSKRSFFSSKECLQKKRFNTSTSTRHEINGMTKSSSMRLYFPQQQTEKLLKSNKNIFS